MGKSFARGHAYSVRRAGTGCTRAQRVPAAAIWQPCDEGNASGSASAFLRRQIVWRVQLAEGHGHSRFFNALRIGAHVPARREVEWGSHFWLPPGFARPVTIAAQRTAAG